MYWFQRASRTQATMLVLYLIQSISIFMRMIVVWCQWKVRQKT